MWQLLTCWACRLRTLLELLSPMLWKSGVPNTRNQYLKVTETTKTHGYCPCGQHQLYFVSVCHLLNYHSYFYDYFYNYILNYMWKDIPSIKIPHATFSQPLVVSLAFFALHNCAEIVLYLLQATKSWVWRTSVVPMMDVMLWPRPCMLASLAGSSGRSTCCSKTHTEGWQTQLTFMAIVQCQEK